MEKAPGLLATLRFIPFNQIILFVIQWTSGAEENQD
jgi:hypothetical protein